MMNWTINTIINNDAEIISEPFNDALFRDR